MIQASIVPTRPLRNSGSESKPERKSPTQLRNSRHATADDPVVLLTDADRSVSHGYLRGLFSAVARPLPADAEP